jgi:predicted nucleotidyltransferase
MIVLSREEVLEKLHEFKRTRGEEYRLTKLGVFGSVARGEASESSDIDVVFETTEPDLLLTSGMKQELETLFTRRVDVIRLREHMNPLLRERIIKDAHYV